MAATHDLPLEEDAAAGLIRLGLELAHDDCRERGYTQDHTNTMVTALSAVWRNRTVTPWPLLTTIIADSLSYGNRKRFWDEASDQSRALLVRESLRRVEARSAGSAVAAVATNADETAASARRSTSRLQADLPPMALPDVSTEAGDAEGVPDLPMRGEKEIQCQLTRNEEARRSAPAFAPLIDSGAARALDHLVDAQSSVATAAAGGWILVDAESSVATAATGGWTVEEPEYKRKRLHSSSPALASAPLESSCTHRSHDLLCNIPGAASATAASSPAR
jgi:hypothetical protein